MLQGFPPRFPPNSKNQQAAKLNSLSPISRSPWLHVKATLCPKEDLIRTQVSFHPTGLTGVWRKDAEGSDSMDDACDMVALPWILRKALLVLNTLQLQETDDYFMTNLKAGGLMDVVEKYPWVGEEVAHPRRDKRRGQHLGRVVRTTEGPSIEVRWDDPHGGECRDTFILSSNGHALEQRTEMRITQTGRSTRYVTRYQRVIT